MIKANWLDAPCEKFGSILVFEILDFSGAISPASIAYRI